MYCVACRMLSRDRRTVHGSRSPSSGYHYCTIGHPRFSNSLMCTFESDKAYVYRRQATGRSPTCFSTPNLLVSPDLVSPDVEGKPGNNMSLRHSRPDRTVMAQGNCWPCPIWLCFREVQYRRKVGETSLRRCAFRRPLLNLFRGEFRLNSL